MVRDARVPPLWVARCAGQRTNSPHDSFIVALLRSAASILQEHGDSIAPAARPLERAQCGGAPCCAPRRRVGGPALRSLPPCVGLETPSIGRPAQKQHSLDRSVATLMSAIRQGPPGPCTPCPRAPARRRRRGLETPSMVTWVTSESRSPVRKRNSPASRPADLRAARSRRCSSSAGKVSRNAPGPPFQAPARRSSTLPPAEAVEHENTQIRGPQRETGLEPATLCLGSKCSTS